MQNKHVSMFDRVDFNDNKKEIVWIQPLFIILKKSKLKMNQYILTYS